MIPATPTGDAGALSRDELMPDFLDEARLLLDRLQRGLVEAETAAGTAEGIADLFRAAHTLKGHAAMLSLDAITSVTHAMETVLERARSGGFPPGAIEACLRGCDLLLALLNDAAAGSPGERDTTACVATLLAVSRMDGSAPDLHPSDSMPLVTSRHRTRPSLRVDAARLDQMINVVGELAVARARLALLAEQTAVLLRDCPVNALQRMADRCPSGDAARIRRWCGHAEKGQEDIDGLVEAVRSLTRYTGLLQADAMHMRMMPLGPLLHRFHRVVRDLARTLGKVARTVCVGDDVELDKKVVDELVDPLTQLVRNAIDHGIEPPEERRAAGKSLQAEIRLEAGHEHGQVVIRVSDDGRGMDPARLRRLAIERGHLHAAQAEALTDAAAIDLIFLAGFSTAHTITDVSGRGVGMDVVRERIAALKGDVTITTRIGNGTTITIRLPLTLSMFKALLVEVGSQCIAIPLESVREVIEVKAERVHLLPDGCQTIQIRDQVLRLSPLGGRLGYCGCRAGMANYAVVVTCEDTATAIGVDRVLREEEVVVKPLPPDCERVRGFTGATILGDGSVALILDHRTAVVGD